MDILYVMKVKSSVIYKAYSEIFCKFIKRIVFIKKIKIKLFN